MRKKGAKKRGEASLVGASLRAEKVGALFGCRAANWAHGNIEPIDKSMVTSAICFPIDLSRRQFGPVLQFLIPTAPSQPQAAGPPTQINNHPPVSHSDPQVLARPLPSTYSLVCGPRKLAHTQA